MTLTITLTSAGANIGPCNLYSNVNNYVTAFATGITRAQLMSGYISTVVPNDTTIVRITSTGSCTDSIDINVSGNSPITFTVTTTCDDPGTPGTGRVVLSNFQGGNGVYSYVAIGLDPTAVAIDLIDGLTPLNGATSYTYTGLANDGWFTGIADSTGLRHQEATVVACNATTTTTTTCDPSPNWVFQYYNCFDCATRTVERDLNPCSPTYLNYKLDGVNVGNTAPSNTGACNTSQTWVVLFGTYDCYETCNKYFVEVQNNPCATGYGNTRQGALAESNSTFCGGCCGQSTAANWVNRDINTYYVCVGVDKYYQQIDSNPCSATYNTTQTGALYETNSVDCGYVGNFTITWSNNFLPTGTNNLQIFKNGNIIVDQSGQSSGNSFTVTPSDIITYNLYVTSPNFSYAEVYVSTYGSISDCAFGAAYAINGAGVQFTSNATIDGIAIDYTDGCP